MNISGEEALAVINILSTKIGKLEMENALLLVQVNRKKEEQKDASNTETNS